MLANLATALFEHGRLTTTEAKARRLRPVAERLITFAKRGDLHARRQVLTVVRDKSVVHTLFTEIGPRFEARQGGYTRITKIGPRKGDNAPMVVIELVEAQTVAQQAVGEGERARRTRFVRGSRNDARPAAAAEQERNAAATSGSTAVVAGGATAVGASATTAEGDTMATGETTGTAADDAVRNAETYSENESVAPVDDAAPIDVLSAEETAQLNADSSVSAGTPADDAAVAAAAEAAGPADVSGGDPETSVGDGTER